MKERGQKTGARSGQLTPQRLELERLHFGHDVLVLVGGEVVVLDEMDDVGEGEHACEALCRRVVERGGDDACVEWREGCGAMGEPSQFL